MIFVQGGGAYGVQLAARQGGLEHVASVHGALCGAGAHDGVELIDEQDDLAAGTLDLFQGGLEALFKFAAEAGAGDHGAQVQREQALAAEDLGDVVGGDLLGQALNDGGLAYAGFTDQYRVVLGAARQDLDDAQDFVVATDDRIQLALAGQLGEVSGVFFQGAVARLGLRVGDALPAAQLLDGVQHAFAGEPGALQQAGRRGAALIEDGQENVLGGYVFVFEPVGFFVGDIHDALDAWGNKDLPGAAAKDVGLGAGAQDIVQPLFERVGVYFKDLQQLGHDAFRLLDKRQQYMFGIYLVMPIALNYLSGALRSLLGTFSKTIKSHHLVPTLVLLRHVRRSPDEAILATIGLGLMSGNYRVPSPKEVKESC